MKRFLGGKKGTFLCFPLLASYTPHMLAFYTFFQKCFPSLPSFLPIDILHDCLYFTEDYTILLSHLPFYMYVIPLYLFLHRWDCTIQILSWAFSHRNTYRSAFFFFFVAVWPFIYGVYPLTIPAEGHFRCFQSFALMHISVTYISAHMPLHAKETWSVR